MNPFDFRPVEVLVPAIDPNVAAKFLCERLGFVMDLQPKDATEDIRVKIIHYGPPQQNVALFKDVAAAQNSLSYLVLSAVLKERDTRQRIIEHLVGNSGAYPLLTQPKECAQDFALFLIPGGLKLKVNFMKAERPRA